VGRLSPRTRRTWDRPTTRRVHCRARLRPHVSQSAGCTRPLGVPRRRLDVGRQLVDLRADASIRAGRAHRCLVHEPTACLVVGSHSPSDAPKFPRARSSSNGTVPRCPLSREPRSDNRARSTRSRARRRTGASLSDRSRSASGASDRSSSVGTVRLEQDGCARLTNAGH